MIEPDHPLSKRVLEERGLDGLQPSRERVELIAQGLRGDLETVPTQDALLPSERDVVEVLELEHAASAAATNHDAKRRAGAMVGTSRERGSAAHRTATND